MARFSYVDPGNLSGPALVGVLEHARSKVYDAGRYVAQQLLANEDVDVSELIAMMRKLSGYYAKVNREVAFRAQENGLGKRQVQQ